MSISELIEHRITEAFPFEVELRKLYNSGTESPHAGFYRNDRDDESGWLPHAVGHGYVPHTRQDVIDATQAGAIALGISKEDDIQIGCSWSPSGHRIAITASDDYRQSVVKDDFVWPSLIVRANYGRAFVLSAALKRDLCSNLMMTRVVSGTSVSLRHRSNFRSHFNATVDEMKSVTHTHEDVMMFCKRLASKECNAKEYIARVLPQPIKQTRNSTKRWEAKAAQIIDRLYRERNELNQLESKTNLWQLANAFTGWVQHDSARHGNPDKQARAFLALDDQRCHQSWNIAYEYAMSA